MYYIAFLFLSALWYIVFLAIILSKCMIPWIIRPHCNLKCVCVCVCVCVWERKKGGEMGFVRWPLDSLIRAPQGIGFKYVNPNKAPSPWQEQLNMANCTYLIQVLAFLTNTSVLGWPWEPGMVGLYPGGNSPYTPSLLPRVWTCDMMGFLLKYTYYSNSDYLTLRQTCSS